MTIILITGFAGFLGKNLIKQLLAQNNQHQIIGLDNFISSSEKDFTEFIYRNNLQSCDIRYRKCNISDKKSILEFLTDINYTQIHEIYHLASIASPPLYKTFPLETLDVGFQGTKNILEIAHTFNAKFLFSSTSEVYGDPTISPQHEEYYGNVNTIGERSCYDISKRIAETLCYTFQQLYHIDIKIARIFNTYGPEMNLNDGRIITQVIKSLLKNDTLTIYGSGNQTRSVCYVDDTIQMLIQLMHSNCQTPVNIGNDTELTINQITKDIEDIYKKYFHSNQDLKRNRVPLTQNDPLKRKPCLIKNKAILGERHYTTFTDGIQEMLKFYTIKK
jgi:UDP-glucuronate decarboxylase